MVRTGSILGNPNGNHITKPCVVEHTSGVMSAQEQLMMSRVQSMIRATVAKQSEEMTRLIPEDRTEATSPVEQLELNIEQFEEGNYRSTVSRVEPQAVRIDNPDKRNEGNNLCECRYKDFMLAKT